MNESQKVLEASSFTVERVTGNIGARISGIDVRAVQPSAVAAQLTRALHEHGVLFFSSNEPISDEEHRQFARSFGEVGSDYDADSAFFTIDSVVTPIEKYPTDVWHHDGTSRPCPPQAAVLRCIVTPLVGGDTMWASMYAAYDSLSSRYQGFLDGLQAVHDSRRVPAAVVPPDGRAPAFRPEGQIHPVVIRDPVTRRRLLYVNSLYTQRVVGMTDAESERLLSMLFEHVNTPEFHVRLRWIPNTIAVWEERVTQHRVINDYTGHRQMKRLIIRGESPTAA
jgi:taurine dioxygenase